MKKLKLSLLAVALMVATVASAQVSFGIQGGVNLSNMNIEGISTSSKFGFNAGLLADFGLTHDMGIRSGLHFTTKGTQWDMGPVGVTFNLMYLQVPVHFAYKVDVMPGTRIVFHGGPYVAYGVGGNVNFSLLGVSESLDAFGDDGALDRFDFGLGIGVGAEFGRILVGIGWDMGLLNIIRDNGNGNDDLDIGIGGTARNQNAFLTVGFRF